VSDSPSAAFTGLVGAASPDPGPSVFVSYASADRPQARNVLRTLEAASIETWIDVDGITGGHGYGPEIVDAIRDCSMLLLLCSTASRGAGSRWAGAPPAFAACRRGTTRLPRTVARMTPSIEARAALARIIHEPSR
jgi:hypothetical protein